LDREILLWFHAHVSPRLDWAFVLSWVLGTGRFCVPLVLLSAGWYLAHRRPREALAWIAVGLGAGVLPMLVKVAFARPRPTLWPWLLPTTGSSFPSAHAVAGAALYPLLGWLLLQRRGRGIMGYALGLMVGGFIGVGRLYVGVHWPSDVLAGWVLGGALSATAVRCLAREAARAESRPSAAVEETTQQMK
jgi:membrane-associated phospholipid phosphatase